MAGREPAKGERAASWPRMYLALRDLEIDAVNMREIMAGRRFGDEGWAAERLKLLQTEIERRNKEGVK